MTKQEKFERLQARWQSADERMHAYAYELRRQYGDARGYCWNVPRGKEERRARLDRAESVACERFILFLEHLNPARSWRQGFPVGWLMSSLTWDDATTTEAMSVTPPPAYGYTTRDAEAFSGAIA